MFLMKSISETKSSDSKEGVPVEDRLVAVVSEVGLSSKLDETLLQPAEQEGDRGKVSQQKDDRCAIYFQSFNIKEFLASIQSCSCGQNYCYLFNKKYFQ